MAKQFDYQAILKTYKNLQRQANRANRQRYKGVLSTIRGTADQVGQTYNQTEGLLRDLGRGERERISMGATRAGATAEQDLISRGLGNTTIRQSVQRGIAADKARANRELTEQVGRQRAGVKQARAGFQERIGMQRAGVQERRTDRGPDLGMFAQMMSQVGAGQAAEKAAGGTLKTGLSANARAGRDVFGQPFGSKTSGGSSTSGAPGAPSFGQGGGGGGGGAGTGGKRIYTNAANQAAQRLGQAFGGGGAYRGSGTQGAGTVGPGAPGGAGDQQVGILGDERFLGQDVYRGGTVLGQYTGQGTVSEERELLNLGGELDTARLPASQGGDTPTLADRGRKQPKEGESRGSRLSGVTFKNGQWVPYGI